MDPVTTSSDEIDSEEDNKIFSSFTSQQSTADELLTTLNETTTKRPSEKLCSDFQKLCGFLNYPTPITLDEPDSVDKILEFCESNVFIARFIEGLKQIYQYDIVLKTKELFGTPNNETSNCANQIISLPYCTVDLDGDFERNLLLSPYIIHDEAPSRNNSIDSTFVILVTPSSDTPYELNSLASGLNLDGFTKFSDKPPLPVEFIDMADFIIDDKLHVKNDINNTPMPSFDAFLLFNNEEIESDPVREIKFNLEEQNKFKLCIINRDIKSNCLTHVKSMMKFMCDRCNSWLIVVVSEEFLKSSSKTYITDYAEYTALEDQKLPKIILCVFGDFELPEELKCHIHLKFNTDGKFYNPWDNIKMALKNHKNKTLTHEDIDKYSHQKLELKEASSTISADRPVVLLQKTKRNFLKVLNKKWNKAKNAK